MELVRIPLLKLPKGLKISTIIGNIYGYCALNHIPVEIRFIVDIAFSFST